MSTLAVVEAILRDAAVPLSVREIVERAGDSLPTKSKTPDTVVARDLSMDIKKKGEMSLFVRTSPGRYGVREIVQRQQEGGGLSTGFPVAAVPPVQVDASGPTPVIGPLDRAPTRPVTKPTNSSSGEMSA